MRLKLGEFVNNWIVWIVLGLTISTLIFVRRMSQRKKRPITVRDVTMTVEGRRLYTDRVFLERLCDSMLECVLHDEMSEIEANAKLALIAKALHREEIMPLINAKKPKFLKAQLKANARKRALNGKTEKLPIPDKPSTSPAKPKNDGELLQSLFRS